MSNERPPDGQDAVSPAPYALSGIPSAAPRLVLSTLEAVLERITYANDETGYTIARVSAPHGSPYGSANGDLLMVRRQPAGRAAR